MDRQKIAAIHDASRERDSLHPNGFRAIEIDFDVVGFLEFMVVGVSADLVDRVAAASYFNIIRFTLRIVAL
jgi:hypothetical protein